MTPKMPASEAARLAREIKPCGHARYYVLDVNGKCFHVCSRCGQRMRLRVTYRRVGKWMQP